MKQAMKVQKLFPGPFLLITLSVLLVTCTPSRSNPTFTPQPITPEVPSALDPEFSSEFDRLFLSHDPLRYQDNREFLQAIPLENITPQDVDLVRTKLKVFLSLQDHHREYAPDSEHTDVASEIAFLRLGAVQILAQIGTTEDAHFLAKLEFNPGGEHPLFENECRKAIESLNGK
jgi:hypothetical protein